MLLLVFAFAPGFHPFALQMPLHSESRVAKTFNRQFLTNLRAVTMKSPFNLGFIDIYLFGELHKKHRKTNAHSIKRRSQELRSSGSIAIIVKVAKRGPAL